MKNKNLLKKIAIATLLIHFSVSGYQIITFFMVPYPIMPNEQVALKKVKNLTKLGKLSKYTLRAIKNHRTAGILCSYDGYLAFSDLNGQVIFPRKHKEPAINILVTEHIVPVTMIRNTIHHWELDQPENAKMYRVERDYDEEIKAYFWNVMEAKIPKDNIIDLETIIIFANEKYVAIPEGITLTTKNPQLILPDIFIKKGITKVTSALYTFGIKNFFQPNQYIYKKEKQNYLQQLKN